MLAAGVPGDRYVSASSCLSVAGVLLVVEDMVDDKLKCFNCRDIVRVFTH